jgi:Uma2 family endonuclease
VRPRVPRKLAAEEFFWLAEPDAKELVDGEIVPMTPTLFRHGKVAGAFVEALRSWARRTGAGVVVTAEVGFVTRRDPDRVRAPDVAFVSQERLAGRDLDAAFFEGAPDLPIEVVSPSDRHTEVLAKVAEYLGAGARCVWVADPRTAQITIYRPDGPPATLGPDDDLDGEGVLPGFRVRVADLFAD